ncbi:MAG: selenide, water dikinase SelD, partial [Planctomycetales bacterium]
YLVGRVAALNALSDLWAMGSQPLGALALVTLPEGEPSPQTELLYQVLAGGVRELTAAGAQLWGGHTTQGAELTIGYSVAGRLDDAPPFTKGNLQPGDRLILTKPLGTGTLLAANRLGRCQGRWMEGMLSRMLQGNGEAARLAREFAVTAATDVTGFGLAGHLLEMLDASRMSASLALGAIPLLEGFASLCQEFPSSLAAANRGSETRLKVATSSLCDEPPFQALFDPQTSGGLLIAAAADRATALRDALAAQGLSSAIIGSVGPFREGPSLDITS